MRRLILLRHAKAVRPKPGVKDRDRVLTGRGRREARLIGSHMANDAIVPDRVVISPSARTQETWKFASPALRPVPDCMTVDQIYDSSWQIIFSFIKTTPASVQTLLMIGHNPEFQSAAIMLIASGNAEARAQLHDNLPTSGLIVIDFGFDDWDKLQPRSGRLDRFVTPKSLKSAVG